MAKDWIKKAINPEHKGFCSPMTKSTCTPKRKALAKTFKKHHGFHKGENGYNASEHIPIDIYSNPILEFSKADHGLNIETTWDNLRTKLNSKEAKSFEKWKSQLPDRLQDDRNYDLKGFYKQYGKQPLPKEEEYHLTDEFKLPNHPTFSSESRYYNPETEYLGGKWDNGIANWTYSPNSNLKQKVIERKSTEDIRRDFLLDNHNMISRNPDMFKKFGGYAEDCLECGGMIKAASGFNYNPLEMERDIPMDSSSSYNRDIQRFNYNKVLQNLPMNIIQQQDTANYQNKNILDKNYSFQKTPKGYINVYDKGKLVGYSLDGKTLVNQEPQMRGGGMIQAWIQKADPGINIYGDQQLMQPLDANTNNNWGMTNENNFVNPNSNPQNSTRMDMNQAAPNINKNVEAANKVISPQSNIPKNNIPKNNPLDMIGNATSGVSDAASGIANMTGNKAAITGMQQAQQIGKIGEGLGNMVPIPGVGKAVGGALSLLAMPFTLGIQARKAQIKKQEVKKMDTQNDYYARNTPATDAPSYYGQYYSKYGSNPKNMEQRIMDDIYSDFDKYMKLT